MKYLELNDITAYNIAFELSNYIWNMIIRWDYFAKFTVGEQFVKAIQAEHVDILAS